MTALPHFIRTVVGDVTPTRVGRVNYHEHLFQRTPLLPGDELDDEVRSRLEAADARSAGIDTIIDATPWGLGRKPEAVARIAEATGLQIVATAGFHRQAHYEGRPEVLSLTEAELADKALAELTEGQPVRDLIAGGSASAPLASGLAGMPVRAGILKGGVGYWSISAFEARVLSAIGSAHRSTGAPIMVHLEHGSCAHEVLDRLKADGVPEDRVILAHIDRSPDHVLYSELAARGAFLGCDGAARLKDWPESLLIDAIVRTAENGHLKQVLLGGDVARATRYLSYGGLPGIGYLTRSFAPRVEAALGADGLETILRSNPQQVLSWTPW